MSVVVLTLFCRAEVAGANTRPILSADTTHQYGVACRSTSHSTVGVNKMLSYRRETALQGAL